MSVDINPAETLGRAREFAADRSEAEFLLVRKEEDGPNVGKLQVGNTVQQEISATIEQALIENINNIINGRTQTRSLSVANTVSDGSVLQCGEVTELPDSELFQLLNSRRNHRTTTYSEDPKPDFQLVRISEPDGRLLIGVQNYTGATLVDTTNELALLYKNQEYERFREDLLILRPRFNAYYYDGWVFVISPKSFESMFELRGEYERRAQEAIDGFNDAGITFAEHSKTSEWLLSHIYMLRSMNEIYENNIYEFFTPDKIEEMIQNYRLDERFSIDYTRKDGQIELAVNEYQHTWKLLKLLGGKFAEDDILGTQWEIDSGERL
jgi:hypothetical protein